MYDDASYDDFDGYTDDCGDDVSEYADEPDVGDEPWDGFNSDAEADADVLRMAGWGTDEDYGYYGNDE